MLSGNPLFYWNFNEAGATDAAIDLVGTDAGDHMLPEYYATRAALLDCARAKRFSATLYGVASCGVHSSSAHVAMVVVEIVA